jgi:hypothetical protein
MCFSEFIVAIVGITAGSKGVDSGASEAVSLAAQRVLIAFVCFYIAFFAISWGPVIWALTGRAVRARHPRQEHITRGGKQLAVELWHRVRDTVSRRPVDHRP